MPISSLSSASRQDTFLENGLHLLVNNCSQKQRKLFIQEILTPNTTILKAKKCIYKCSQEQKSLNAFKLKKSQSIVVSTKCWEHNIICSTWQLHEEYRCSTWQLHEEHSTGGNNQDFLLQLFLGYWLKNNRFVDSSMEHLNKKKRNIKIKASRNLSGQKWDC